MAREFPFHAGALFKWVEGEPNDIQGRVILLIESGKEDSALEMRKQLMTDPKLILELLETVRPWPSNIVKVNSEELNKHIRVREIFTYDPENES